MMSGYLTGKSANVGGERRRYTVIEKPDGWCVSLNGMTTGAFPNRAAAATVARSLQHQADNLNHVYERKTH